MVDQLETSKSLLYLLPI